MKWIIARTPAERAARQRKALFVVLLGLLISGIVLVNVVTTQLAQRWNLSYDLTANAAYQAGPETRAFLANLAQDVDIYVLAAEDAFGGSPYFVQAQRMMAQYPRLSPRVTLSYVDYVYDPTFAARYPDLTLAQGNVLVVCGDRVKQLQLVDLFNYTYTASGSLTILSSRAEEALTSAILYVTSTNQARVAVLTGYGVADMVAFRDLLVANNWELTDVSLTLDTLDSSYDLALLLGPQIDLSEQDLRKLDTFLYNDGAYGKTLLYTADVTQEPLPNAEALLKEWGLVIGSGAVFETTAARTYQHQPFYPVAEYVDATRRDQLKDPSVPVLMPLARPLTVQFEARDTHFNEVLLQFSETSGVRPAGAAEGFTVDQAERWGPMPALVLSSTRIYGTAGVTQFRSNLVASSSTAMLDAFSIQNTSLANSAYLLNLLNGLCEREDTVNIQPKSLAGNTLAITTAQANTLGILLAAVLPVLILGAGIVIWLVRRRR